MTEIEEVIAIMGEGSFSNLIENDNISEELLEKLFTEYYIDHEDMPYGTKKARTGDPHRWIYERLLWLGGHQNVIPISNVVSI